MCILLYVNYASVTLILKWREYKEFGKRREREPVPEAFESVFLELLYEKQQVGIAKWSLFLGKEFIGIALGVIF